MITMGYENNFQKYMGNKWVVLQMFSILFTLALGIIRQFANSDRRLLDEKCIES